MVAYRPSHADLRGTEGTAGLGAARRAFRNCPNARETPLVNWCYASYGRPGTPVIARMTRSNVWQSERGVSKPGGDGVARAKRVRKKVGWGGKG